MEKQQWLNMLKKDVIPALGCTEPVCVALCVAYACAQFSGEISSITIPTTQHILDNYDILSILEKNQLWKLVLKEVIVYRSQTDKLSIRLYPNLPQVDPNQCVSKTT